MKPTAVFDTECYINYWLLMFRDVQTGRQIEFEMHDHDDLDAELIKRILQKYRLVSFNGNNYDMPMIAYALAGATTSQLKEASDRIIVGGLRPWQFEDYYSVKIPRVDHVDLIEVAPGQGSLKTYGGRLHSRKLQDLPIEPSAVIAPEHSELLRTYCGNDLVTTQDLLTKLTPQIELRERMSKEYGQDLRSKSDAQIAEAVIKAGVAKASGQRVERPVVAPGTVFRYRAPPFLFNAGAQVEEVVRMVCNAEFVVSDTGKVEMPKELASAKIKIGQSVYRMGIGGLHSSEQRTAHFADEQTMLIDRDVASYYPAIILGTGLQPAHMGRHFTNVYRKIVEDRLAAKKAGDKVTADALKITINGSFGKFGSKWSNLYSPDLMIQTTLTGQLALLMLIERIESYLIPVVSANTDGIVIKCPTVKAYVLDSLVSEWEQLTGFVTEDTEYAALYSRDVNNFIATKLDGGYKAKGAYAETGLMKNPANAICVDAVAALLTQGTPVERTIRGCTDVRKFLTLRKVNGGALDADGTPIGKVVRWYYARGMAGHFSYATNGNKVPRSDGAKPLMELPDEFPADVDFGWYIGESLNMLSDIGYGR